MSCQTDIVIQYRPRPIEPKRPTFDEEAHLHDLINAQNDLLRMYEHKAVHDRQQRQFQLSPPPEHIEDCERRLYRCQKEKEQTERRAVSAQKRMKKLEKQYEEMRPKNERI